MIADPATIACQIAAIQARIPDYWRDDACQAEAAALWGGGCNPCGVFTNGERETIAKLNDSCKAEIVIAESGNGLFSFGIRAEWGMGATAVAPSVWREPFGTRTEARRAAIQDLVAAIADHGSGEMTKQQRLLLAEVRKANRQRGLFD